MNKILLGVKYPIFVKFLNDVPHLCTRKIEIGDKFEYDHPDYPGSNVPCTHIVGDVLFNRNGTPWGCYDNNRCFKILGRISKDAIPFAKEGDEYSENEIKQRIEYSSSSSWGNKDWIKKQYGDLLEAYKESDGGRDEHSRTVNTTIYLKEYKLRGPCGHFH